MQMTYYDIYDATCLLVREETDKTLEYRLLRRDGTWIDGTDVAIDHLGNGDTGADKITAQQAVTLAKKLNGKLDK